MHCTYLKPKLLMFLDYFGIFPFLMKTQMRRRKRKDIWLRLSMVSCFLTLDVFYIRLYIIIKGLLRDHPVIISKSTFV